MGEPLTERRRLPEKHVFSEVVGADPIFPGPRSGPNGPHRDRAVGREELLRPATDGLKASNAPKKAPGLRPEQPVLLSNVFLRETQFAA
jgi:hypothetical protein